MMNKIFVFSKRNIKEIIREPVSLIFCVIFPVVMLCLMQAIFINMEYTPDNFRIDNYAVGICVFGYTFAMMSIAMLISGDKSTEFINRLKMAPVSKASYMFGYVISVIPVVFIQTITFFAFALIFGLPFNAGLPVAVIYLFPSALFYISTGVLIGTISVNEKQSGPFSSIIVSVTGILGGIFMPVDNLGIFTTIAQILPFYHTTNIASGVFQGNYGCIYPHILVVLAYTLFVWILTLTISKKQG